MYAGIRRAVSLAVWGVKMTAHAEEGMVGQDDRPYTPPHCARLWPFLPHQAA